MGNTAVITGAASGIGLETARDLLERKWTVFGLDAAETELQQAEDTLASNRFVALPCDVRSADAVRATMARVGEEAGAINALICSAGVIRLGALSEMSVEDFDLIFSVNTRGLWLCAREAMPWLKEAARDGLARIVFLSSVSALRPKIESGAYAASKAAVSQLTRVLAAECAKDGILVNALAPGTVDTPMIRNQSDPERQGGWRPSGPSPLGRVAEPLDVVRVVRFLLSEEAGYVTGTTIPVDGGTQAAYVPPR
ncbi:MAG: SDR family oxidoreductase [Alphaproteobacteria bacterium]|jgi:NAD(P)-dependent dehydrogenase (short-subunit alcohol dehydrogenase family)|nr:SDR family oxidoreductase [Alphaproteobacteria bacterium]